MTIRRANTLLTLTLVAATHPDKVAKAQEELDRVVGTSRLPVSADRDRLPYIMAMMKETHRWHPVTPMGLPHLCTAEDEYKGYRIPKNSILLPNTW